MTCILVVDDEPAVLKVLVTRINLAGYQVLSAQDGEQALDVFHKEARLHYDLERLWGDVPIVEAISQ